MADKAQTMLVEVVGATQDAGALPPGDPVRLASLLRTLGPRSRRPRLAGPSRFRRQGHASLDEFVDDLFDYLRGAAKSASR